jgi:hypothetical protein
MNVCTKIGFPFVILVLLIGSSCAPPKKQNKLTEIQGGMVFDDRIEKPNRAEYSLKYFCGTDKFELSFATIFEVDGVSRRELLKIRINGRRPINHSELEELYSIFSELKEPSLPLYPICGNSGSRLVFISTTESETEERGSSLVLYLFKDREVNYAVSEN